MLGREFGGARLVLGLMLGLGLVACGGNAAAQQYVGDSICGACHADVYATYIQHGHPWQEVPTGRQSPGADLFGFASVGVGLPDPATVPTLLPNGWADVAAILGNFKDGEGTFIRASDGKRIEAGGTTASTYPAQCFECHNPTGYQPTGTMYGIATWAAGAPASDPFGQPLQGVQCEHCHGPSGTMQIPSRLICRDCHSTTKKNLVTGVESDPNKRIPFAPTADGKSGVFTNHHSQGDEFRRSPHKAVTDKKGAQQGCVLCHDPHKSVWHDDGGIKFAEPGDEAGQDNMCTHCHQNSDPDYPQATKVRLRGAMGEIGLACVDCHMPEKSGGSQTKQADGTYLANGPEGERHTHLFRINPTAMKATDNVTVVVTGTPPNTTTTKYWNSTDLDGDSFLTLDMVCTNCHDNMTLEQMAKAAKTIHRTTEMLDLTVNNSDELQILKTTDVVSVAFSVDAGERAGMKADWWVISQGPRGWSSWDGKRWRAGLRAWRKGVALADVPPQTVLKSKLAAGHYTYWLCVYPTDGSQNLVSVPVYVTTPPKPPKAPRKTARR